MNLGRFSENSQLKILCFFDKSFHNRLMEIRKLDIATKKDLPVLNHLCTDTNDKSLMSEAEIIQVWHQIRKVFNMKSKPEYYTLV